MSIMTPPTINSANPSVTNSGAAVRAVQNRLRLTQRRLISHRIAVGLFLIIVLGAICLALSATVDWFFELALVWRATWIAGVAVMAAVASAIGSKRWIMAYTLSDTAVDAESRLPQFGQRLRTALDYEQRAPQPAAASPSLLSSLHHETFRMAEQTEWGAVIDARPLLKVLLLVITVSFAWLAALVLLPEFRISAARALLLPFEYTTVSYMPENSTIRPGESVTVIATVSGRPVSSAQLRYRPSGSRADWVIVDLVSADADENDSVDNPTTRQLHGNLSAVLSDLRQDIEFEVLAGPRALPEGLIRVLQPLTLEKSEVRIVPPSYTGRPEETLTTLDMKVLEGSTVELELEFNRPAAEASLTRLERASDLLPQGNSEVSVKDSVIATTGPDSAWIPLQLQNNIAVGTLTDLRKNVSFTLSAHTADGMSLNSQQINIRVQPDLKPRVQFIEPPEELIVTATTEIPMIVEAGDDLGLHKVGVMFQIGSGPIQTLLEQDAGGSTDVFRLTTLMMLEEHRLTIQDAVTYYAFAEDNYFDQPRRTTTPLRFIDIRPYKMEFQIADSDGGGESSDGSSVTLEELISRQRQALSQAFQSSQQPTAKETISRLVEGQEEILDATFEFSSGMAERGAEVPSLDEAILHMDTAIDALNAQDLTNQDLTNAVAAEQLALAALIRARENLRTMLKQSNSQSASTQRKFDRQMRQKLRMPKKKQSDQQEQLAQTRHKLEDLAKREREWSKQAQQCCNSSASSSGKPSRSKPSQSKSSQSSPTESNPSESNPSETNPSDPGESPAEVAEAQEKLQAELAEIQKQLEKLNAAGQAARDQAQQAAESMQQGLAELKQNDGNSAAREGERSADQLEQLSAHLAAMNARDFGQRLDEAQKVAQQLASHQQALDQHLRDKAASGDGKRPSGQEPGQQPGDAGKTSERSNSEESGDGSGSQKADRAVVKGLARDQQALATQTKMLAEVLDGLERDATGEAGGVQQKLQQAQAENPPRDIAAGMSQTADDLQAGQIAAAGRGAAESLQRLQELSKSLGAARGEFAQPQLKELLALEEQLAQLQEQMKRAQSKGDGSGASVGQKWQQLEARLDKLATADQRLAEAMRQLRKGPQEKTTGAEGEDPKEGQPGSTTSGTGPPKPGSQLKPTPFVESDGQQTPEGFYSWLELGDISAMREVSKALQTRIQEAILAGALMDADQPVPPAYKELVEKYYRALSDDLR